MHEHGIAHRDLKPENILLDDDYYPRVCDFGFSKYCTKSLPKSTNLSMSRQFGTPLYLPPEILSGDEIYNQSVDVYAFALIAYEIVTGKQPFSELFESTSEFLSYQKIIDGYRPKFPSFVDEKMRDLITRCWSERPEDRPTFKEIFEELSNDLTYFTEFVDETEIQDYLYLLSQTNEEQQKKKSNSSLKSENQSRLEKQLNELKAKISELQNDQDLLYKSNEHLYLGLVSLLGDKNTRNLEKVKNELKISSKQGNRYASFILGLLYETGEEFKGNIKKSLKYYEISSQQKGLDGLRRIGYLYANGYGVKQNHFKAKDYFEKAADCGNVGALTSLGFIYERGNGVYRNYVKAIELYEKAADLGDSLALTNLGYLYQNGLGCKQDYKKAIDYYQKAAELSEANALTILGVLYYNGEGVKKNHAKAKKYFEKAVKFWEKAALKNLKIFN